MITYRFDFIEENAHAHNSCKQTFSLFFFHSIKTKDLLEMSFDWHSLNETNNVILPRKSTMYEHVEE